MLHWRGFRMEHKCAGPPINNTFVFWHYHEFIDMFLFDLVSQSTKWFNATILLNTISLVASLPIEGASLPFIKANLGWLPKVRSKRHLSWLIYKTKIKWCRIKIQNEKNRESILLFVSGCRATSSYMLTKHIELIHRKNVV